MDSFLTIFCHLHGQQPFPLQKSLIDTAFLASPLVFLPDLSLHLFAFELKLLSKLVLHFVSGRIYSSESLSNAYAGLRLQQAQRGK